MHSNRIRVSPAYAAIRMGLPPFRHSTYNWNLGLSFTEGKRSEEDCTVYIHITSISMLRIIQYNRLATCIASPSPGRTTAVKGPKEVKTTSHSDTYTSSIWKIFNDVLMITEMQSFVSFISVWSSHFRFYGTRTNVWFYGCVFVSLFLWFLMIWKHAYLDDWILY